jgi:hypothetical protein
MSQPGTATPRRADINFASIAPAAQRTAADAPAGLTDAEAQVWADGFNAALATNDERYFVIWSGGSEADLGFYPFTRRSEAQAKFDECAENTADRESRVDLMRVSLDGKVTEIATFIETDGKDADEEE